MIGPSPTLSACALKEMPKAVLDTNIYFGALLAPRSAPGRVIQAWREGRFQAVSSPAIIAELRSVLRGIPTRGSVPSQEERARFIRELEDAALMVDPDSVLDVPGISPGDNRVLEAALAAQADHIVTNDRPVLALQEFHSIPLLTPSRFLAVLES